MTTDDERLETPRLFCLPSGSQFVDLTLGPDEEREIDLEGAKDFY